MKKIKELLPYILILVAVILLRTFVVTPVRVNGVSMAPTLDDGEIMLLNKLGNYERFSIVVVDIEGEKLIKRIIALPNEEVEIKENIIYINGEELKDEYGDGVTFDQEKVFLEKDEYFVLGDNRENSKDSRYFGGLNKEQIDGVSEFILYPFDRFGSVE